MSHKYIILRHMKINRANGKSSTITGGIPALTAWMGSIHLLERKMREKGIQARLPKMAVVYHKYHLLTYNEKTVKGNITYITNNRNPMTYKDRKAQQPSFNEEIKINLDVTLIIELISDEDTEKVLEAVKNNIYKIKAASGDILEIDNIEIVDIDEKSPEQTRQLLYSFMPGYVLISRKDLILKEFEKGNTDGLDAMLKSLVIHEEPVKKGEDEILKWQYQRKEAGWIIPIAVGFKALSPAGKVKNQRDPNIPHRFAESIVTLGEMKIPIRFKDIDEIMWEYAYDPASGIYEIKNTPKIVKKEIM